MSIQNKIYLDNAATTKTDQAVQEAMAPYLDEEYGNASSLHYAGLDNRVAVDRAQAKIAGFLGCDKQEVYFTSGATESDNMAILGVAEAISNRPGSPKKHLITTQIEHDAVLEPCRELEKRGWQVTYLAPDKNGQISAKQVQEAVLPETALVSIMYVNNEIGSILPIAEIGQMLLGLNVERVNKIYFHTDATQAVNFLACQVADLGVDLLSLSGHKIHGPKGVGALYLKASTLFKPLMFGGHQQSGVRPGTYNVPAIVGLGAAVDILNDKENTAKHNEQIKSLRDYLIESVLKNISGAIVTGGLDKRAPNNASFIFEGLEGEDILLRLSEKGIAVSTGSACASGSLDPSHVLLALCYQMPAARGSLRITLSKYNTQEEIDVFLSELETAVNSLRQM